MTTGLPDRRADRIRRAGEFAADLDVELLLVTPGTDLRYLIGAGTATHERLTCLVVPAAGHRAPGRLPLLRQLPTPLTHYIDRDWLHSNA